MAKSMMRRIMMSDKAILSTLAGKLDQETQYLVLERAAIKIDSGIEQQEAIRDAWTEEARKWLSKMKDYTKG